MFETGVTQKLIADSGTIQHLIANRNLIRDYYDDYSEYQTGSGEILPSYRKSTLLLPIDNGFLKLTNVWYAPDLGFNLISTIELGEKEVEIWLQIIDQPSQILHDKLSLDTQILLTASIFSGQKTLWNRRQLQIQQI